MRPEPPTRNSGSSLKKSAARIATIKDCRNSNAVIAETIQDRRRTNSGNSKMSTPSTAEITSYTLNPKRVTVITPKPEALGPKVEHPRLEWVLGAASSEPAGAGPLRTPRYCRVWGFGFRV